LQHNYGAVTAVLLNDRTRVRSAFGLGANFVVYKPVSAAQAEATLRAAVALLRRERRRSVRIPVQVPVWLRIQSGPDIDGILLDLSESGMELLSALPLCPSASVGFRFALPNSMPIEGRGEVAWANPNGQAGVRFADLGEGPQSRLKEWVASSARSAQCEDLEPDLPCKLTDISLGGCYIETESPLPEYAGSTLLLKTGGLQVEIQGIVRVMHPGFGMGIEFASSTSEQSEQVCNFIELLTSQPGAAPVLSISPAHLSTENARPTAPLPSAPEDPLLDLLRHHESLSQDDFLKQLRAQRAVPTR
jgi:PilZ domain